MPDRKQICFPGSQGHDRTKQTEFIVVPEAEAITLETNRKSIFLSIMKLGPAGPNPIIYFYFALYSAKALFCSSKELKQA